MNLMAVGDTDLAPLGVIERAEVKVLVLDDTGRVVLADEMMVGTSAARATAWVVFTRHRLTCVGGVDPAACGCGAVPDAFHVYLAEPNADGAIPVRPDEPLPPRQCMDCPPENLRPITKRGRCATHYRQWRKVRGKQQHRAQVRRNFGLVDDEYDRLYEAQGGRCAICRTADGTARRLSVDHCHDTGEVRGLLCAPCNKFLGRRFRNSPEAFARGLTYLVDPPARAVLPLRPEADAPPLSPEGRARAVAVVAEQVARCPGWGDAVLAPAVESP